MVIEEPIIKSKDWDGGDKLSHPSFGQISLSKVNCGDRSMYGSSIKHDNYIALRIKESSLIRQFHEDKCSASTNKSLIEVALSPLQFSELLTTMNYGDGIPCTIEHRCDVANGQGIKFPEEVGTKDKLKEFLDEAGDITKDLQRFISPHLEKVVENLDTGKSLGKGSQQELLSSLQTLMNHLGSNPEFLMKQFTKYMEQTVVEAKATIDSHVDTVVKNTGLEALRQNKMLSD